jgi:hypothetical protein
VPTYMTTCSYIARPPCSSSPLARSISLHVKPGPDPAVVTALLPLPPPTTKRSCVVLAGSSTAGNLFFHGSLQPSSPGLAPEVKSKRGNERLDLPVTASLRLYTHFASIKCVSLWESGRRSAYVWVAAERYSNEVFRSQGRLESVSSRGGVYVRALCSTFPCWSLQSHVRPREPGGWWAVVWMMRHLKYAFFITCFCSICYSMV